jgi:hypothetical protein
MLPSGVISVAAAVMILRVTGFGQSEAELIALFLILSGALMGIQYWLWFVTLRLKFEVKNGRILIVAKRKDEP